MDCSALALIYFYTMEKIVFNVALVVVQYKCTKTFKKCLKRIFLIKFPMKV